MTAIETYAGRGELYCGHCDLTIGGNEAKTPDELTALLEQRTCHMRLAYEEEDADGCIWPDHYECDACGAKVNGIMPVYDTEIPPKYCPNCRARVVRE